MKKSGLERTTRAASKAGLATAKTSIFASRLSRLLPLRFRRKPSRVPNTRANWQLEDAMIRVCYPGQCQSWKPWPCWCCAITACDNARFQLLMANDERPIKEYQVHLNDRLGSARAGQDAIEDVLRFAG